MRYPRIATVLEPLGTGLEGGTRERAEARTMPVTVRTRRQLETLVPECAVRGEIGRGNWRSGSFPEPCPTIAFDPAGPFIPLLNGPIMLPGSVGGSGGLRRIGHGAFGWIGQPVLEIADHRCRRRAAGSCRTWLPSGAEVHGRQRVERNPASSTLPLDSSRSCVCYNGSDATRRLMLPTTAVADARISMVAKPTAMPKIGLKRLVGRDLESFAA